MELLLDRARRKTRWSRTEPDRDLPSAWSGPIYVPGRCTAASESTSGHARRRANSTALEYELRNQSVTLGSIFSPWSARVMQTRHLGYLLMRSDGPSRIVLQCAFFLFLVGSS